MNIKTHTNIPVKPLGTLITDDLLTCTSFSIATAFIDAEMVTVIKEALSLNSKLRNCTLVIGVFANFNRKNVLNQLKSLSVKYRTKLSVRISRERKFHLKYYAFTFQREFKCYVGSANLTLGGMRDNLELMMSVTGRLTKDAHQIAHLRQVFSEVFEESGDIGDFDLNGYIEQKRLTSAAIEKLQSGNEDFFNKVGKRELEHAESNKAVLILLSDGVSKTTEKIIQSHIPSWDKAEYFMCNDKRELEQYRKNKLILAIDKYSNEYYCMTWIKYDNAYTVNTPDGKYAVTYTYLSKEKRMTKKMLENMEVDLNIKLRGWKYVTEFKVLRERQYKAALELFPINK